MFYWMVPRLYGTKLHSTRAANAHFYLGTVGILLYVVAMWVSGVTQGLMWKAESPGGGLMYPSFVETLAAILPMYWVRLVGGTLYLAGMVLMAWNLWRTARAGKAVDGSAEVVPLERAPQPSWVKLLLKPAPILVTLVTALALLAGFLDAVGATGFIILAAMIGVLGWSILWLTGKGGWHRLLEGRPLLFTVLAVIAVLIGGVAEIVPTVIMQNNDARSVTTHPYRPLELAGRDIYVREGCYTCHSQMIRPFVSETLRYGDPSRLEESIFDHPFQWGSKRTGPDLARVGGKSPSSWHYLHLYDPRSTSPGSNMPPYAFLTERRLDLAELADKVHAMQRVGVPYADAEIAAAPDDARAQAAGIVQELAAAGIEVEPDREIVALIAYLQKIGKSEKVDPAGTPKIATK